MKVSNSLGRAGAWGWAGGAVEGCWHHEVAARQPCLVLRRRLQPCPPQLLSLGMRRSHRRLARHRLRAAQPGGGHQRPRPGGSAPLDPRLCAHTRSQGVPGWCHPQAPAHLRVSWRGQGGRGAEWRPSGAASHPGPTSCLHASFRHHAPAGRVPASASSCLAHTAQLAPPLRRPLQLRAAFGVYHAHAAVPSFCRVLHAPHLQPGQHILLHKWVPHCPARLHVYPPADCIRAALPAAAAHQLQCEGRDGEQEQPGSRKVSTRRRASP